MTLKEDRSSRRWVCSDRKVRGEKVDMRKILALPRGGKRAGRDKKGEGEMEVEQILVIVEIPKGGRNKYEYDEGLGRFRLTVCFSRPSTIPPITVMLKGRWPKTEMLSMPWSSSGRQPSPDAPYGRSRWGFSRCGTKKGWITRFYAFRLVTRSGTGWRMWQTYLSISCWRLNTFSPSTKTWK